jgi:hypothetical protein
MQFNEFNRKDKVIRTIISAQALILFIFGSLISEASEPIHNDGIDSSSKLGIYLVETGELYFSDLDFEGYAPKTYEFVLNKNGIEKWNSCIIYQKDHCGNTIPKLGKHYQKQFVLKIGEEEIYRGIFTSMLSSTIFNSIVIQDIIMKKDSLNNRIQVGIQRINNEPISDLRNDSRIIKCFKLKKKLK